MPLEPLSPILALTFRSPSAWQSRWIMASENLDEKAIFNVARQIGAPDARAEYLRQACGADSGLRERVHVLLRAYEEQASFLESPPPVGVAPTTDEPASESPGTVIGPYKLLQQIGEGGM